MSFESTGPEVYQYAPNNYPSFNASPFLMKSTLPASIQVHRYPHIENISVATPEVSKPSLTFQPNNYQLGTSYIHSNPPPPIFQPPFRSEAPVGIGTRPQIRVQDKFIVGQMEQGNTLKEPSDDRYEGYLSEREEYKYNIFSFADEPWNRCMQGQGCGKLPGNQCIVKSNPKKYWI